MEPAELALNKLDEEFLKKAVAEVEKRLDDTGFSTEQFAEAMNMSRANLHIKMKALTGAPATDFSVHRPISRQVSRNISAACLRNTNDIPGIK